MTRTKQLANAKSYGPEARFKDKLLEVGDHLKRFEVPSDVSAKRAVLRVTALRIQPSFQYMTHRGGFGPEEYIWNVREAIEKMNFIASLDVGTDGVNILIGRFSEVYDESLNVSGAVKLISDPEIVRAMVVNRITALRGGMERQIRLVDLESDRLENFIKHNPSDTLTRYESAVLEREIGKVLSDLHATSLAIELLKRLMADGKLTHLLHIKGSKMISPTHAILSIKPEDVRLLALQKEWGTYIDSQNYELGYDTPPHDVRVSVEFTE